MNTYLIIAVIFICLILEALYSGGEIALIASDITRLKFFARRGSFSAGQAVKLMEKPEWFISTTLIGTNLAIIAGSTLATGFLIGAFGPVRGEKISLFVMLPTLFMMIMIRRTFLHRAEAMAIRVALFIRVSAAIFYPLAFVIALISKGAVSIFTGQEINQNSYITREGLKYILGENTKGGDILKTEKEMVSRVFDFSELTADKIMIPISVLTALPITTKIEEAAAFVAGKKYLRIPVYQDQVINIVGILNYFDLLAVIQRHQDSGDQPADETIATCLQPEIFYVPETKKASELLMDLQKRREHMAVVVDEYGGAIGIVTIEDIGEEIVGSIDNEYDSGEKLYKKLAPGRYLINGRIDMDALGQLLATKFPEGNYETLGGFLMHRFGKIPQRRERLDYRGITFIIENADQKSIKEALVIFPAQLKEATVK
jgi:putative hemolysin